MINLIRNYFARRRIKGMFGNYVSATLVERSIDSGQMPAPQPAYRELTPFFASVHSYVGLAAALSPAQLHELLPLYFEACTAQIEAEGGTIDKFIGDAIVAMFGAPLQTSDHALRACTAALQCQVRVAELRTRIQSEEAKWPALAQQLRVRIGLHTGTALVGNLGTKTRANYTMMGDDVNLAARMEKGAESYGVWTLCTETTQRACEHAEAGRIVFRPLGRIVIKGRAHPIELFEPAALREDAPDQLRECIAVFTSGLARWRERDWDGTIAFLEKSAHLERDQPGASPELKLNPSTFYLELARSYRANPDTGPLFT